MRQCPRQRLQWPFPRQCSDAHDQIDDLQDGNRFDGGIEAVCDKVPEDLGPKEAFDRGANLPYKPEVRLRLDLTGKKRRKTDQHLQAAADKMMRRAQWFLIRRPMVEIIECVSTGDTKY